MIPVAEALARLRALVAPVGTEPIDLRHAAGRVLAADITARRDQPPFPASAMDGYALGAGDFRPGARLRVIGESSAGHAWAGRVTAGTAVRIFTGAPVPEGASHVVMQEDVAREGDTITLGRRIGSDSNVRPAGQDFRAGDRIAAPRRLSAADLALIAAMNVPRVTVARRPVLAILATGDELVMPGEDPAPDQIIASNGFALAAMAEAAGAEARLLPIARDTRDSLHQSLSLAADADLIVTIGGASVGDHDLVAVAGAEVGLALDFWKVAIRPGKPLMAGRIGSSTLLGLPGNPVSAIICGHIFMRPMIAAMLGLPPAVEAPLTAELAEDLPANGPRQHYMRARLDRSGGRLRIRAFPRQDSSLLSLLSEADALLVRPPGDPERRAGDMVDYLPFG